ncbi:MAG: hypothetical protein WKF60_13075, partial [Ilumatobacter sp.]
LTRKQYPIAIVMAGLPVNADHEPTFLRRSHKPDFDLFVDDHAIRYGRDRTARLQGWEFDRDALSRAVRHSAGVPYMMQLVGYEAVEEARNAQRTQISVADVTAGATSAARAYASAVIAQLDVTRNQMRYLVAMAVDEGPSATGVVAQRLGVSAQHANVYRDQLLKAEIVDSPRRGLITYREHWMRSNLRAVPGYEQFDATSQPPPSRVDFDATHELPRKFEP